MEAKMSGFIPGFNDEGVVTVNRVLLKPEYSVDDLEERVALLCENVKTYHSDTGFVGGFVALNSGMISNEGSTVGQAVESPLKEREALIVTSGAPSRNMRPRIAARPSSRCFAGAGIVRERQRGNRLPHALVRQSLFSPEEAQAAREAKAAFAKAA
jgi:hypothetical protein